MVLKRKRSDSEISSHSSLLSSPLSSNFISIDSVQSKRTISSPSLYSSRTHKRHRDNRPSDTDVHQHTLSLLYSAQTQPQRSQLRITTPSVPQQPSFSSSSGQSSLHSFWTLPSTRHSSPSSNSSSSDILISPMTVPNADNFFQPQNCEDCDALLNAEDNDDAMDVDVNVMEIDSTFPTYACTTCGKQVCHSCAVSNLGAERNCLICAGKKKWVGGLGWMKTG